MIIDKKLINHIVLITLAIASMPIPTHAMLSHKQAARERTGHSHKPTKPDLGNASSSSSASDSSGSDTQATYGKLDGLDAIPTPGAGRPSGPSGFAASGGKPHGSHHTGSYHHHSTATHSILSSLRPSGRVSGHRPPQFCKGMIVCGAIAFVVALTQMYAKKQKAKKDAKPKPKNAQWETFDDANSLHS